MVDIRNDRTLKLKYKEVELETFWIFIREEYQHIAKKALTLLLQFSTSYLCELGFSTLTNLKCIKRERLQSVEEMRVPNIQRICHFHQAQVSH